MFWFSLSNNLLPDGISTVFKLGSKFSFGTASFGKTGLSIIDINSKKILRALNV